MATASRRDVTSLISGRLHYIRAVTYQKIFPVTLLARKNKLVLTKLGPDISETGVPEGQVKFITAGEEDSFM
jgi:hypothetical protein